MKIIRIFLSLALLIALVAAIGITAIYMHLEPQLPSIDGLKDIQLQTPLRVYSAEQRLIAEFGEKRRIPLKYQDFPDLMVKAFLAAEDASFFTHPGVDYKGLTRAGIQLLLTGKRRQGGSTITMQVARNYYLSREKTFTRKINEILLALRIENQLSKEDILELYLNKIYLGQRAYGVGAAAQIYYGKEVSELDLAEIAMIAGLPKAPSAFNPIANPERAITRRNYVLSRMHELGFINDQDFQITSKLPVIAKIHAPEVELEAPYIAEMVRSEMLDKYGEEAYTRGFNVYTSISDGLQNAANSALRKALEDYDRRHGWRGPEDKVNWPQPEENLDLLLSKQPSVGELIPGIVSGLEAKTATIYIGNGSSVLVEWKDLSWARPYISENKRGSKPKEAKDILALGDLVRVQHAFDEEGSTYLRLSQIPKIAGAFVSIDPQDGKILALTGGYDFFHSKFNRVIQAKRQPGSGFKAFIYSAGLEAGFTAASLINDAPVVFDDTSLEGAWRPENYSGKFFGPTRLRFALTKSRNLVSIRLLRSMGIQHTLNYVSNFGFDKDELPTNLSLALGSANVTPLEMSRGYAVLANGGFLIEPYFIQRIEDADGEVIFEANPAIACIDCETPARQEKTEVQVSDTDEATKQPNLAPRVISKENRYLMYSMMQDVIQRGTATRAKVLGRKDLAGKTGTTNDQRDAWFNGFNEHIVANVWVGFDSNDKLGRGEVGGKAALPAWIDFMKVALKDIPDESPTMPSGMVTVRIDPKTGLRAPTGMKGAIFEIFRPENVPEELSPALTTSDPESGAESKPVVRDLF